jgi:hypothetical protein
VLTEIWAEALGRERLGVEDNFFELGGHSLLATRVVARMREALRVEVPLRIVFEAPTIAGQARKLVEREAAPGVMDKTARVWLKLKRMSADEKRRMLQQRKSLPQHLALAQNEIAAGQTDSAMVN